MAPKSEILSESTIDRSSKGLGIKHSLVKRRIVSLNFKPTNPNLDLNTFDERQIAAPPQVVEECYAPEVFQKNYSVRPREMSMSMAHRLHYTALPVLRCSSGVKSIRRQAQWASAAFGPHRDKSNHSQLCAHILCYGPQSLLAPPE